MSDENDKVMDVGGLARYLSLSRSTVYKLAQEGALPGHKVGKHWRFRRETVNNWLDAEHPPKKPAAPQAATEPAPEPGKPGDSRGPQDAGPAGAPPLGGVFSREQVERLKERWIETADQVLAITATPRGMAGVRRLLGLGEKEFAAALGQLRKARGRAAGSAGSADFSTEPGGELGLRIEDIPGAKKDGEPDEQ